MKILLSGPIEGHLESFYNDLDTQDINWVVCAGDYGIWPDPHRMDRASKHHAADDFSKMYIGAILPPIKIQTLTIAGVHDDNRWLRQRKSTNNLEVLHNVHWLAQGMRTTIGWDTAIRVTGIGRAYSESTYNSERTKRSHRHYTRTDVEKCCSSGPTDLFVVYEHLDAPGIRNAIFATRPKLILTTKHTNKKRYESIQNIPVIALDRHQTKIIEWNDHKFNIS